MDGTHPSAIQPTDCESPTTVTQQMVADASNQVSTNLKSAEVHENQLAGSRELLTTLPVELIKEICEPDLAAEIRRMEYAPEAYNHPIEEEDPQLPERNECYFYEAQDELPTMLFQMILTQAINLEELTVIAPRWNLPAIEFRLLRHLHIEVLQLSISRKQYPGGSKTSIEAAPCLVRLWLGNCEIFLVQDILDLARNIRRLKFGVQRDFDELISDNVAALAEGLPNLTTFEFIDNSIVDSSQHELLVNLRGRKDDLTQIYIHSSLFFIDLALLSTFENLKDLGLDCNINGMDEIQDEADLETISSPLAFPRSLESLWIRLIDPKAIWLIVRLSRSLYQYGHLEWVQCRRTKFDRGRNEPGMANRIFMEKDVHEKFEESEVEFDLLWDDNEDNSLLFD
ncbi:hypothetical protein G7Z17_g8960 [Cylindrodendrum hubeiense]|uniref:Uncharacterized protein n=1 Tax=Cylindrodendrum hubeiense TaxID=595255 RepID=A0A9P5HA57_9HYPO|nr:hypothetical protein G7Z17_g8960 [Cylindrodendrum hubeiense]